MILVFSSFLPSMEISSLLHDLQLNSSSSSVKPLPCTSPPPITELLPRLQEKLIGPLSDSEAVSLIGHVESLFQTADPDWLFSPASSDGNWAELRVAYKSLVSALIGCVALPVCEDDCGSLPPSAYQGVPSRAAAVCSALTVLLGTLGNRGIQTGLLLIVAPEVCVFAVTHFQVSVKESVVEGDPGSSLCSSHQNEPKLLRSVNSSFFLMLLFCNVVFRISPGSTRPPEWPQRACWRRC